MALRNVHSSLKAALVLNDEFAYAHLIKFEKPKRTKEELFGEYDYAYITDGPYPINYEGNTYLPKNVKKVGSVKEHTLAKATNMSLVLSADALGTETTDTFSISTSLSTNLEHYLKLDTFEEVRDEAGLAIFNYKTYDTATNNWAGIGGYTAGESFGLAAVSGPDSETSAYPGADGRGIRALTKEESLNWRSQSSYSAAIWIKDTGADTNPTNTHGYNKILVGDKNAYVGGNNAGGQTFGFEIDQSALVNTDKRAIKFYPGEHVDNTTVTKNNWFHLAFTYDGTSVKFYINGVLKDTVTNWVPDHATGVEVAIGSASTNGNFFSYIQNFIGDLSEARFYSRALSATEVTTLYNNPAGEGTGSEAVINGTKDFLVEGFHQGDTVKFTDPNATATNHNKKAKIIGFKNNNTALIVESVGSGISAQSSTILKIETDNSELSSLLIAKSDNAYASYIHREVEIHRAFLKPQTAQIIGEPVLLFRGHINTGSLESDPAKGSKVTWALTSHWGDFVRVNGRLTSDRHHRALDSANQPDVNSLINKEYEFDRGFEHADKAVNMIANYMTYEKRYKMKRRGGLAGALGLKRQIEYDVEVIKDVDLRFNLSAKYLPVIYGVQKTDSFPVFADTEVEDPNTDILESSNVFAALAICEGEISGIYDIHIDDASSLCTDQVDYDVRGNNSPGRKETAVYCMGRADRGQVLGSFPTNTGYYLFPLAGIDGYIPNYTQEFFDAKHTEAENQIRYSVIQDDEIPQALNVAENFDFAAGSSAGVGRGQTVKFDSPITTHLDVFTGTPTQHASGRLALMSQAGKFTIQQNYYDSNTLYWSANHRLLDTAYVAGQFTLKEGETTIPKYTFVVKGSYVNCHNYDGSFTPGFQRVIDQDQGSHTNFIVGEYVKFYDASHNQISAGSDNSMSAVMITDKFDVTAKERVVDFPNTEIRYQWTKSPNVGKNTTLVFYMKKTDGSTERYWFVNPVGTYVSGGVTRLKSGWSVDFGNSVSQVSPATSGGNILAGNSFSNPAFIRTSAVLNSTFRTQAETLPPSASRYQNTDTYNPYTGVVQESADSNVFLLPRTIAYQTFLGTQYTYDRSHEIYVGFYDNVNKVNLRRNVSVAEYNISHFAMFFTGWASLGGVNHGLKDIVDASGSDIRLWISNWVNLESAPVEGQMFEIEYDNGRVDLRKAETIISESGNNWIKFNSPLTEVPNAETRFVESGGNVSNPENIGSDLRVTTNPAMQLLDYLTNKRYGKGLDIDKDIDLESFKAAGRQCDERSDVTVIVPASSFSSANVGSVYKVNLNNDTNSRLLFQGTIVSAENVGGKQQVTFTDVVGKLCHRWNDWKVWQLGDILYYQGKLYNPVVNTNISLSALLATTSVYTGNITLRNVTGTGPSTVNIDYVNGDVNEITQGEGNPLVRKYNANSGNFTASGYSLYDSDNVKYWKLCGWDQAHQRNVTRHQTNCVIDTSKPVFANVNLMLSQFNGILRYTNGKYSLDVKTKAPDALSSIEIDGTVYTPGKIHKDDIIGRLKIVDKQQKDTFNSISTQIVDPQNKFGTTDVTFFNSEYLLQDRNINKQGTLEQPHVTNYYNARMNVEQHLDNSRAGLKVSFKTLPKALLLIPGDFIQLTHPEYGFNDKLFRISDLTLESDALVTVEAEEYFDKAFRLSAVDTGIEVFEGGDRNNIDLFDIKKPSGLSITQSTVQAVTLAWTNSNRYSPETHSVEILRSSQNLLSSASSIATTRGFEFTDYFDNTTNSVTNYYWIRYNVVSSEAETTQPIVRNSAYLFNTSVSASSGFVGVALPLKAENIKYNDGKTIEVLEPTEGGADSTSNALNNNVGGTSSSTLEVTSTNGGMIFNQGGAIRSSGKLNASSSTAGFFVGYDTNKYTFGVGDDLNNIEWDGTNLSVTGKVTAASGAIGGWKLTGSSLYAGDLTDSEAANFTPTGFIESLCATQGAIVLHNQGSLHSKDFFINSDGSASFRGDISGAVGTFSGGIGAQSITGQEIEDGSIGAEELAPEAISGFNISPEGQIAVFSRDAGTGDIIPSSYAALDGSDDTFRIYAGDTAAASAPFRVTKEGQVTADNLQLFDNNNNLFFDSATGGFSDSALTQIAQRLTSRVDTFSELFSGDLNLSAGNEDTYEKITLTQSTNTTLTTTVKIPARMAKTHHVEYYGNRSNPYFVTVNCSGLTSDCSLNLVSILKPGGIESACALKLGELVRINLENTVPGMALKSVVGAKNALSGSDFANPTAIGGPATINFILFELDSTSETFSFTISSANTGNITMNAGSNTAAKPDTETLALASIPTSVEFGLSQRTTGSDQSTSSVVLASAVFSRTTGSTPAASQYRVKTFSKDIIDVDSIHSSVGVVTGGAVDSQGFITRSSVQLSRAAGDYFYYTNLTVTGGDVSKRPTSRLFNISVGSNDKGFIIQGTGTATQSDQSEAFSGLVLSGNMSVPDDFTIDPGNIANDVIIAGNLVVQGTTTTSNSATLEVGSKTIIVSANATTASAVHESGISVDRSAIPGTHTDPTFLWNETSYSAWKATHTIVAPQFRSTGDGTSADPAYIFGDRKTYTGIFATETTQDGLPADQINITTSNKNDSPNISFFNFAGIHSHANLYTGEVGEFRNLSGTWKATTGTDNQDFQFIHNTPTNTTPILHMDACAKVAAINSAKTKGKGLYVASPTLSDGQFNQNASSACQIQNAHIVVDGGTTSTISLLHSPSINEAGRINFIGGTGTDNTSIVGHGRDPSSHMTFNVGYNNLEKEVAKIQDPSKAVLTLINEFQENTYTSVTGYNFGFANTSGNGVITNNKGANLQLHNNAVGSGIFINTNTHNHAPSAMVFSNMAYQDGSNYVRSRAKISAGTAYGGPPAAYGFIDFSSIAGGATSDLSDENHADWDKLLFMSSQGTQGYKYLFGDSTSRYSGTNMPAGMYVQGKGTSNSNINIITDHNAVGSLSTLDLQTGVSSSSNSAARLRHIRGNTISTGETRLEITGVSSSIGYQAAITAKVRPSGGETAVGIGSRFGVYTEPKVALHVNGSGIDTFEEVITTTSGSAQTIATFLASEFRSAKVMLTMQEPSTGKYLMTELSVIFTGASPITNNVHMTEYGTVVIGGDRDCFFDVTANNGEVRITTTNPNYTYPGQMYLQGKRKIYGTMMMHNNAGSI